MAASAANLRGPKWENAIKLRSRNWICYRDKPKVLTVTCNATFCNPIFKQDIHFPRGSRKKALSDQLDIRGGEFCESIGALLAGTRVQAGAPFVMRHKAEHVLQLAVFSVIRKVADEHSRQLAVVQHVGHIIRGALRLSVHSLLRLKHVFHCTSRAVTDVCGGFDFKNQ